MDMGYGTIILLIALGVGLVALWERYPLVRYLYFVVVVLAGLLRAYMRM